MAVRERRDVRPADVAREVGVSGATVSDWEAGKIIPRDDTMERLADFLGVTRGFLRFGEESGVLDRIPKRVRRSTTEAAKAPAAKKGGGRRAT